MADENINSGDTSLHEDEYWCRQKGATSIDGCHKETLGALVDLGKWFFEKTGKRIALSCGTNGSHAGGEYSHANGWKLDLIDYGGADGLNSEYFGDNLDTQLAADFAAYGHSLGLGMNIECPGTNNTHFDVQCGNNGYEWTTGMSWGGYKNPNGRNPYEGITGGGGASSPRSGNVKDQGHMLIILPANKTYCEPMYPDYLYVAGNIPDSLAEKPAANLMSPSIRRTDDKKETDPYDYEYDNGEWQKKGNTKGSNSGVNNSNKDNKDKDKSNTDKPKQQ